MVWSEELARGRAAFEARRWRAAFEALSAADREAALAPEDLARLGDAAYLVGKDDDAVAAWTRAHHQLAGRDDRVGAARLGFWTSLCLMLGGKAAQSRGWLSRAHRLIADTDCPERGLLLCLNGLVSMAGGQGPDACAAFEQATSVAQRHRDTDVLALSLLGHGQALIQTQRTDEGLALLDESMVAVTSGQVCPILAGIVYCAVILTCERVYDLRRAHEWTVALDQWCELQSELVAFRAQCLVHRSELKQLRGDWPAALDEAGRAGELLSDRSERLAGRALYQQAEVYRLRGQLDDAGEVYRQAAAKGFEPQPGVSLLRMAQGKLEIATASIRRVEHEAEARQGPGAGLQRLKILGPFVEIMIAAGELDAARAAAEELDAAVRDKNAPFLKALAGQTRGAVLLASGAADAALVALRDAWTLWQQLEAPYEAARVRVLIARACEQLGDLDTATMHVDAAALVFERLGAEPDLARIRSQPAAGKAVADLSERERQVLALVASGRTNKQIAGDLGISEHTVARHISNIFNKIGVTSRTAASAFAFKNALV